MKFYLAASYGKKASARAARNVIEALGHEVTSRWIDGQSATPDADSDKHCIEWALTDLQDINECDVAVVFTDKPSTTGGFYTEFGYAYAIRKKIVVIGPRRNIFMMLPNIMHFEDWNAFLASLGKDGIRNHLSVVPD
jgi:nucleoside 2-deoxyribosyltransferase